MIEKHRERQKELHMVFIDLEKTYDRVPRKVWRCMGEKGVPEKYVRIAKNTYNYVCVTSLCRGKNEAGRRDLSSRFYGEGRFAGI